MKKKILIIKLFVLSCVMVNAAELFCQNVTIPTSVIEASKEASTEMGKNIIVRYDKRLSKWQYFKKSCFKKR